MRLTVWCERYWTKEECWFENRTLALRVILLETHCLPFKVKYYVKISLSSLEIRKQNLVSHSGTHSASSVRLSVKDTPHFQGVVPIH